MKAWRRKIFAVLVVAQLCMGCALMPANLKNYGSFEPDEAIYRAFETYQVNPDLVYYISGSDVYPNAIMGLDKRYVLETSLWKKVAMTPHRLKDMVQAMQKRSDEMGMRLQGWSMRDEGGRAIGVWYSVLFATTSIKTEGENRVTVYRPPQSTFEDHSDNE